MVTVRWVGDLRFEGRSGDAITAIDGDGEAGPSPVSLLLESVAACTGADVVDILRKGREKVEELAVEVVAMRQTGHPRYVKRLELTFRIRGDVPRRKAERAIDLSLEKYCSVFHSLRKDLALDVELVLEEGDGTSAGSAAEGG
ncbi:MAG: OsmC family protein [Gemmatimonadota bacterium]